MEKNGPTYSSREVIEILERARELGVISIKLEGFEAEFDLRKKITYEELQDGNQLCDVCGSEKQSGEYGYYCRPCYIKRKEKTWREKKRW